MLNWVNVINSVEDLSDNIERALIDISISYSFHSMSTMPHHEIMFYFSTIMRTKMRLFKNMHAFILNHSLGILFL